VSADGQYLFAQLLDKEKGDHIIVSLETGAVLWRKHYRESVYGVRFARQAPLAFVNAYKDERLIAFPARAGDKAAVLKKDGRLKGRRSFDHWLVALQSDLFAVGDNYRGEVAFLDFEGEEGFPALGRYIYDSDSAISLFGVDEKAERCVMMGFIGDGQNSSAWAQGWNLKEDRPLAILAGDVPFFCTNIPAIADSDDVVVPVDAGGVRIVNRSSAERLVCASDNTFQNAAVGLDGTVVAAGSANGFLVLWDRASGKELVNIRAHAEQICGLGWQPGGDVLASTSQDGKVKLWSAKALLSGEAIHGDSARPIAEVEIGDMLYHVVFSANGALCAVGTASSGASVIDTKTGKLVAQLETKGAEIMALAFHPRSGHLVTGSLDGTLAVWDVSRKTPVVELLPFESDDEEGSNGLSAIAFDARGDVLLVSQTNGIVRRWNLGA
jgi:hypothetical protein